MEIKLHRLVLLSCHPVLDQVAQDIARGVAPEALPELDIVVCVGAHKRFKGLRRRTGIKVCIQTEHFFDANGKPLWRKRRWGRILTNLLMCDHLLDLSPYNEPAYRWMPRWLRKNVVFGPKIFPSKPVNQSHGNGKAVFYGALNKRREAQLSAHDDYTTLGKDVFGPALDVAIAQASAVLNVHFSEGVYTEYPRLLSAYLAGKPLVSEGLSPELIAGRHYLALGVPLNTDALASVFDNFSAEFAAKNRFTDFLTAHAAKFKRNS